MGSVTITAWGPPSPLRRSWVVLDERPTATRQKLVTKLLHLGRQAAREAQVVLAEAMVQYPKILMATHYPPLHDACWHEGSISNREWLPWFTCKAMGDMVLASAEQPPNRQILV